MKSQVIKIRNLPQDPKFYEKIVNVKPIGLLLLLLLIGALLCVFKPYLIVIGLSMCALSIFALIVMPDKELCRFTKDFLVLYNRHKRDECYLCYWDEVVSWHYEWDKKYDALVVDMIDGSTQVQSMYSYISIKRSMEQHIPGKMKKVNSFREDN